MDEELSESPVVVPDPTPDADGMVEVILPSDATFPVYQEEVGYIQDRAKRYLTDLAFSNVSDLQDVDRMLIAELLCFRWTSWISRTKDYWGDPVEEDKLQQAVKLHSAELRQLKKSLGIDKTTRDKTKGDSSVPAYLSNLLHRAKQFGVHRDMQIAKALELFQELKSLIILHDNCDQIERDELHKHAVDILDWIRSIAIPEFDALDEHFRTHTQQMFVRDL